MVNERVLTKADVRRLIRERAIKKRQPFLKRPVQARSLAPVKRSIAKFIRPKGSGVVVLDKLDKQLFNLEAPL